jgi:hypothetical protein
MFYLLEAQLFVYLTKPFFFSVNPTVIRSCYYSGEAQLFEVSTKVF